MSDRERSRSRNGSRGAKEPVKMSRPHSRSRSHSPHNKPHKKYSGSPSPARGSKSGYRSAGGAGARYRSRSRSPSPKRTHRRYSRSRSRSYNNYRRSSHSHSPMSSRRRHQGDRIAGEVGDVPPWKSERQRSPDGNKRKPFSSQSSRIRHTEEAPTQSRCLGVFGLSIYTTEAQINHIFSKYGPVERVQVVIDAKTGRSRGFCFVYYEAVEDAKAAKDQCTGMEIDGRRIRVDFSITQRAHTPTPGIYMGKPTFFSRDNGGYDRRRDRESDYYGGRGGGYRESRGGDYRYKHSPSPYRRGPSRRYERERSYSPRRY